MDPYPEFQAAHAEHAEILDFLNIWEDALKVAASDDFDLRCLGLRHLQTLEGKIAAICEHCREEEQDPHSPLFRFANSDDHAWLKEEHFRLLRANCEFRRELVFTTASSTMEVVQQGQKLLQALRRHIASEEQLLNHIAREERLLRGSDFEFQRRHEESFATV